MRISVITFAALAAASPIMQLRDAPVNSAPAYYPSEPTPSKSSSGQPSNSAEVGNGANDRSKTSPAAAPSSADEGEMGIPSDGIPTVAPIPQGVPVLGNSVSTPKGPLPSAPSFTAPAFNFPTAEEIPSVSDGGSADLPLSSVPLGPSPKLPIPSGPSFEIPKLPSGVIGKPTSSLPGLSDSVDSSVVPSLGSVTENPTGSLPGLGGVDGSVVPSFSGNVGLGMADGGGGASVGGNGFGGLGINVKGGLNFGSPSSSAPGQASLEGSFRDGAGLQGEITGTLESGFPRVSMDANSALRLGSPNGPLLAIIGAGNMDFQGEKNLQGGRHLFLDPQAMLHLDSLTGPVVSFTARGEMALSGNAAKGTAAVGFPGVFVGSNSEMRLGSLRGPMLAITIAGDADISGHQSPRGGRQLFMDSKAMIHVDTLTGPMVSFTARGEMVLDDNTRSNSGISANAHGSAQVKNH